MPPAPAESHRGTLRTAPRHGGRGPRTKPVYFLTTERIFGMGGQHDLATHFRPPPCIRSCDDAGCQLGSAVACGPYAIARTRSPHLACEGVHTINSPSAAVLDVAWVNQAPAPHSPAAGRSAIRVCWRAPSLCARHHTAVFAQQGPCRGAHRQPQACRSACIGVGPWTLSWPINTDIRA